MRLGGWRSVNHGPARLRYADAFIGTLAAAGFPMPVVARAFVAIDSHTYGFALQELAWRFQPEEARTSAERLGEALPVEEYPGLSGMVTAVAARPEDFAPQYGFGLDLLLDGLERLRPGG
jgi:hypothetical protein